MALETLFLQFSREKMIEQIWPRMRQSVESLTDQQVWWRPNERSNSIGNLLLHLNGNVQQWLIAPFEGGQVVRDRAAEFAERQQLPTSTLLERLDLTMRRAEAVLSRLTPDDLTSTRSIQGYQVTGLYAVYHVVEHFSMHYGQILYVTKWLRDADLGFYRHLDATGQVPQGRDSRQAP